MSDNPTETTQPNTDTQEELLNAIEARLIPKIKAMIDEKFKEYEQKQKQDITNTVKPMIDAKLVDYAPTSKLPEIFNTILTPRFATQNHTLKESIKAITNPIVARMDTADKERDQLHKRFDGMNTTLNSVLTSVDNQAQQVRQVQIALTGELGSDNPGIHEQIRDLNQQFEQQRVADSVRDTKMDALLESVTNVNKALEVITTQQNERENARKEREERNDKWMDRLFRLVAGASGLGVGVGGYDAISKFFGG